MYIIVYNTSYINLGGCFNLCITRPQRLTHCYIHAPMWAALCDVHCGMLRMCVTTQPHTWTQTQTHTQELLSCALTSKWWHSAPGFNRRSTAADHPLSEWWWECHSFSVCVCVCARERGRLREKWRVRGGWKRERAYVPVFVCHRVKWERCSVFRGSRSHSLRWANDLTCWHQADRLWRSECQCYCCSASISA